MENIPGQSNEDHKQEGLEPDNPLDQKVEEKDNPSEDLIKIANKICEEELDVKVRRCSYDDWGLVTIHFKEALITISKEAAKLSKSEISDLISSLKIYRDNVKQGEKPEIEGMGGGGSVYLLNENFVIKESNDLDTENHALQNSYGLQQTIDKDLSFPNDIKLVHSVALVEPSFNRARGGSRKIYTSKFFSHDTVYGSEDDIRPSRIGAYVVMPFVSNAVMLEELLPSKHSENPQLESVLTKLLEDKIIESSDEETIKSFIANQRERIIRSLRKTQVDIPAHECADVSDVSERNVLIRLEDDAKTGKSQLMYYKIDH